MGEELNLATLAEDAAARLGNRKAMVFEGEPVMSFTMLEGARRFHRAFTEMGLKRGKIAALCMVNHPLVYSVFGGIFRTGATACPVMFQLTVPQLRYIFSRTEASCIVTDTMLLDKVREAVEGLDHIEWIAVREGENRPDATPRECRLEDLLDSEEQTEIPDIDPEDTALILFTSGTTGQPKGVMLTHANLIASGQSGLRSSDLDHRPHPMISISALPMAHIFGIGVMTFGYLMPEKYEPGYGLQEAWFDPERFMQLIEEHKCTDMAVVPTMLAMILSHPNVDKYDLSSLVLVSVGGAPVPVELARDFGERYGCRIRQLYGMTENSGMGSGDRISKPYHPGSAGMPYDSVEMRIVDDDDNPLPAGESGEIVTRGPTTMKGYLKDPEATAEAMRGGWLHTGDIGYLDEEGWLYVVDRKKDMIIKGGENIFPAEVENVLYKHPAVAEAAIVGIPHPVYGEDLAAFIILQGNEKPSEEEIAEHVRAEVGKFKMPARVWFVNDLPKSGIGKILRRELREKAVQEMGKEDRK